MFEGSWKMRSNIMDSGSWSGIILILSKWFIQEDPCTHGRTAVCFQFELQREGDMYKPFYLGWNSLRLIQVREWVIKYKYTTAGRHADMEGLFSQPLWAKQNSYQAEDSRLQLCGREFLHAAKTAMGGTWRGGTWSYHHMCHVVSHTAEVRLSAPVPRCVSDCPVLGQGLLVPCSSVKTGPIPICASRCI